MSATPTEPPSSTQPGMLPAGLSGAATLPYEQPASRAFTGPTSGRFGEYELLGELGRGGMGVVFKARQIDLDRIVALKMVLSGTLSTSEEVQRFRTEAAAAGKLQHDHIVQVFEVGEVDGCHYYSMEYIHGPNLRGKLKDGPLPGKQAARYLITIAKAVQHAHEKGIVHRDLKPTNVLVDGEDRPHISDFGLAKMLGDQSRTQSGAVMGTPSYMAPEQAAGRVKELGPACDIYALGAILYELVTGRPPFQGETGMDTLLQVMERTPVPPSLLNPKVDSDLETICLKCLEKHPEDRYRSAAALAADLQCYVDGESISARQAFSVLDQLVRTFDRNQYLSEFHAWGSMLLIFAGIILVEHLIVFALTLQGPPYPRGWIMAARFAQFSVMGLVFWRHRSHTLLPTSAAERQLWSIWIGYLIACIMAALVHGQMIRAGRARDDLTIYPFWSILTGMAFFMMGNNYWGRCYLIGLTFFGLAILMLRLLEWSALIFGLSWAAALVFLGIHLLRLSRKEA